jgi:two-component system sensor histidine kinase YesM
MNPDELSSILSGSFSDDRIQSFIMTPAGQITASSVSASDGQMADSSIIASLQETSGSSVRVRMNSGTITRISPLSNGWFHVTTIRSSYVNENLKATLFSISLILFLTVASILLVSAFLSQSLTSRVSLLSKAMREYNPAVGLSEKTQTALGFRKPSGMLDEIDELSHTFLRMDDSIQSSLASIMELSLSGERLRYKLLLAQINPHFLYNILGTIQVCIHTGKPDIADQMIAELSQFYRLALRRSTEMIRIRDELEIARLYLELEKACHNGQLTWQFHLEDGIENYYICKFTLQPFLENCIHYGYSEADKCVSITLSAVYLDDKVQITIQDTGSGMSKEKLQQLRAVIESRRVDYSKNFGIGSVSWRISSPSYGNGTLKIDSAPGEGTIVTITIDQIEEYSE